MFDVVVRGRAVAAECASRVFASSRLLYQF